MRELPYYRLWVKDFDCDENVRLMDARETGLFLWCMNHSWNNDGLPSDESDVGKLFRISVRDFKYAWPRVAISFPISEDGRRRNPRQERERSEAISKSEKATASVRTRYERRSNELPRAHLRAGCGSVSGSVSALEEKTEEEIQLQKNGLASVSELQDDAIPRWVKSVQDRHPNKSDSAMGYAALLDCPWIKDPKQRFDFDRVHKLWCQTSKWSGDQGRYAPKLVHWVTQGDYRFEPPSVNGKTPPKTPPGLII